MPDLKPMKPIGKKAREAIDNFMEAFPDYEIEYVVADLKVHIPQIKGSLQLKMKKREKK